MFGGLICGIGYGNIARRVERMMGGFDMRTLHYDPFAPDSTDLDTLLAESDYASVHCPLTPETKGLIDARRLKLMKSKLLPCGVLPANSEYDSIRMVSRLVTQAKSELLIIDPYADVTLLDILSEKAPGVTVRLVCKDRGKPTRSEIEKFNRQYKGLTVEHSDSFHDRYILIDDAGILGWLLATTGK